MVARCNNRAFHFTSPDDFAVLLAHHHEMGRTYKKAVYAYTLMSNHVHLLLQAPTREALGCPLRWFLTQTAKAFHQARGDQGHFWEHRYRACLVVDDLYALAALRNLDRNPVRAGLVEDPVAYAWSGCTAYAAGILNPLITYHPSYLALSPYAAVRQRHYRRLLAPSDDPRVDARDPRWTTQRVVGSPGFLAEHLPRRSRRRLVPVPPGIRALGH